MIGSFQDTITRLLCSSTPIFLSAFTWRIWEFWNISWVSRMLEILIEYFYVSANMHWIFIQGGLLDSKPAHVPLEQQCQLALAFSFLMIRSDTVDLWVVSYIFALLDSSYHIAFMYFLSSCSNRRKHIEMWPWGCSDIWKIIQGKGIFLQCNCDLRLYGWCDSDWVGCPLTCRSLIS